MSLDAWATQLVSEQVPFLAHGRDRKGFDCWGLICLAFSENLGITLHSGVEEYEPSDITDYEKLSGLVQKYLPAWEEVSSPKVWDVLLLRVRGRPIHVALVIGDGLMLHIEEGLQVCVERYRNSVWNKRIVGFYRFSALPA